jgi:Tfp pilus assembly protein PilN
MVNINLSTTGEGEKNNFVLKKGLTRAILVAVLWLVIYGGILLYKNNLEKKTLAATTQQTEKSKAIKEGSNKDIFDFQTRLVTAKALLEKKDGSLESLTKIQERMVEGVYLTSYEYNAGKIEILGKANGYDSAAGQILSLKKSEYFSNVETTAIGVSEDGKISFALTLTVKAVQ